MVKNTTGGTGTKGLARKHQTQTTLSHLRVSEDELELYAIITKMLGNGMCEVYTNENIRLIGHIRNKFRGKQKRHNMLSVHSIVLIGLREWENPYKNCDILTMYENYQVDQLRNMPGVKINKLIEMQLGTTTNRSTIDSNVRFTEDIDQTEFEIAPQRVPNDMFIMEEPEDIDINDI